MTNRFRVTSAAALGLAIAVTLVLAPTAEASAEESLLTLRTRAIRAAVSAVADSIVTVERVGVAEPGGGEVAADAPTVAVAIDDQRHFIASSLVIRGEPGTILLVTPEGRRVVASVVAQDHGRQTVLLRAEEDLAVPPLRLAETPARVGQTVIAVGRHIGGLTPAVSTGILSATARNWGIALQTDARVSSAFYGGPLIDLQGRVLGIVVPMVPDGGAEDDTGWYDSGIAFAIPSEAILRRLPAMIEGDDVRPGLAGLVAPGNDPYVETTEIAAIRPRSPAARTELQPGDEIVAIDEVAVRSHREIKQQLGDRDAGDSIRLTVRRGDESLDVNVKLTDSIPPLVLQHLGITAARRGKDPVVITGIVPGSPAADSLRTGDRIVSIDQAAVDSVGSLRSRINIADPSEPLAIAVERDGQDVTVMIETIAVTAVQRNELPESLQIDSEALGDWSVEEYDLPDISNPAVLFAPSEPPAAGDSDAGPGLGLVVLLADPSAADLNKLIGDWTDAARAAGVVVCAIGPAAEDRWTPEEIDVPRRVAAAIRQNHPIDSARQVIIGAGKGPGGAMALAAAILRPGTFSGLSVSAEIRPPAIRLRENDPTTPLQIWLPGAAAGADGREGAERSDAEAPAWAGTLERLGYPVHRGGGDPASVLAWIAWLATI